MLRARRFLIPALLTAIVGLPAVAGALDPTPVTAAVGQVKAGVGVADATWHVGASAGQYASTNPIAGTNVEALEDQDPDKLDPTSAGALLTEEFDPQEQALKNAPSWGVESRLSVRAIVVEGTDGERIALLKSDNYLAQDTLLRRVGQILAKGDTKVDAQHILYAVTHNHSSPYYTTPSWGVWTFQDVMDMRMLEYQAQAMATAITRAASALVPVRMGATTVELKGVFRNAPGEGTADDGTPAGNPTDFNDTGLVVVRFDDISNPSQPKPLATWMNYGVHPEDLDGYDLISGDYVARLERFVDRGTGAPLVFSQGDVGSSEPADRPDQTLPDGTIRAFSHKGYAQAEREARIMSDAVLKGWNEIGAGGGTVPYSTGFPVKMIDRWTPGPLSHPYPSVSNCRTEPTVEGNPGMVVAPGLPDCERFGSTNDNAAPVMEGLRQTGVVPENYDAPSHGAVEENYRIHLQVVRLGEVVLASCSCEAQVDLILNLESKLDNVEGNQFLGFPWDEYCTRVGATWTCKNPTGDRTWAGIPDSAYQRMKAEIKNDAKGWDDPAYVLQANAQPADPAKIKGNFTHEELPANLGFKLPVGVGHAGDYNGYIVSYRNYMANDHYRKALTSYGAHSADYMNQRLMWMARSLKDPAFKIPIEPLEPFAQADEGRQVAQTTALGIAAQAEYAAWELTLPNDAGFSRIAVQPKDITRFDAAYVTWNGGNNFVDNPNVVVERLVGGKWTKFADQSGEVQTSLEFPKGALSETQYLAGNQNWMWTANFEAFDAFPRKEQTPLGAYRFVIDGKRKQGSATVPYHLESNPFAVTRWTGVTVADVRKDATSVSFTASSAYPRTYPAANTSPLKRLIHDDGGNPICKTCSFRPWAKSGTVASAYVTVTRASGQVQHVPATLQNGRWVAPVQLGPGDRAVVNAGAVRDSFDETNGSASAEVLG